MSHEKIAVIGLGYVGLPLALALAEKCPAVWGFDIDERKVAALRQGIDVLREGLAPRLDGTKLKMTATLEDLRGCTVFIVAVPTPVDGHKRPDLEPVRKACLSVGKVLTRGGLVVFESTVYPGVTEDLCGPWIESVSGLVRGKDFHLGYSPERMNPGDIEHSLERVVKVVSGEDASALARVAAVYEPVVPAGIYRATSIKVAEAAKVIENTQRDLNIALMNELALIFDRMGISTRDVLDAAATKWNFLRFTPGLVGGHCIGVDPYYLTMKAEELGYRPEVILAGRRINDGMGSFVAQRLVKLLVVNGLPVKGARVGVLGVTFKENVADIRNSRVPDIINELREFGVAALVHDPCADSAETEHEYGITLAPSSAIAELDALVLAVSHREFVETKVEEFVRRIKPGGVFIDVKSVFRRSQFPSHIHYWSL